MKGGAKDMKTIVVYVSKYGSTREIARALEDPHVAAESGGREG